MSPSQKQPKIGLLRSQSWFLYGADHRRLQCPLLALKLAFPFGCLSLLICEKRNADKTLKERRGEQLDLNCDCELSI